MPHSNTATAVDVDDMDKQQVPTHEDLPLLEENEKTITSISTAWTTIGGSDGEEENDVTTTTHPNSSRNLANVLLDPDSILAKDDDVDKGKKVPDSTHATTTTLIDEMGGSSDEEDGDKLTKGRGGRACAIWPQILASLAVSLGSMIIGFGSAYTSTALPTMSVERNSSIVIDVEGHEASWIGSLLPLGALLGGLIGGTLVEATGRKCTILMTAVPFILSWLLIALAANVYMIYAARAIAGFCVGVCSLSLPVYLAETVHPLVRGTLGLLPTTLGNAGILICFLAGSYLDWDSLAYLGAVLSIPFLLAIIYIPETPRWYVAKGNDDAALMALQWLRSSNSKDSIMKELNSIKNMHLLSSKYKIRPKDLFTKTYMKPMGTSLGLMFFQQFSGINAVIFYTVSIFELSGSSVNAKLATVIVGVVNIASTIGATVLIDRLGRKILLLISDVLMCICLFSLGVFFYLKDYHPQSIEGLYYIPLIAFISFVVAFSLGFGPVPWLMMGEIFPGRIRGTAASIATAFNWTCTFIVTKSFPEFLATFGGSTTFLVFATICFFGLFFIIFCVPETQGKSLEDIERGFSNNLMRRISSVGNMKPFPTVV